MILAIILHLKADFGRFSDRETITIQKVKVPVCINYFTYQCSLLLKKNESFESKVQRIYPDHRCLYGPVQIGRGGKLMKPWGYLTD